MTSTWGNKLGRARENLGTGVQVPPMTVPKPITLQYTNFRNGLLVADRSGDVPIGYYSYALDVETSRRDGVIKAPGVLLVEDTGHSLEWLGIHTSLDFESALVAFDAPFLGVKEGDFFLWVNEGLETGNFWVTSRYGDILLFTNGVVSYSRHFGTGDVEVIPDMPGAQTIFTAFGRVFAGGTILGSEYNLSALIWNGVTGDYRDWTGDGSGSELLIADVEQSDKIVAGRVMSYDLAAILCRRSIWIAARTGDLARPADFQFRILGVGCVAEPTARTTEGGVTFLSDEGIRHFDGNDAQIISSAINSELLPIDFTQLSKYKSAWDASRRRYILVTPTATYIYQFRTAEYPAGAWFKRSITPTNVVIFGKQTTDVTWEDLGEQTWDDLGSLSWFQFGSPEENTPPDILFAVGTRYGIQDSTVSENFGVPLTPLFQPRPDQAQLVDLVERVMITHSFVLEYSGNGTVEFIGYDDQGILSVLATKVLDPKTAPFSTRIDCYASSKAVGIFVRIASGFPEILKIKQLLLDNGPVLFDQVADELLDEAALDLTTEADNGVILWP